MALAFLPKKKKEKKKKKERKKKKRKRKRKLGVVAHAFNPSIREAEAGGSLQNKFQQSYTEKPCLQRPKTWR